MKKSILIVALAFAGSSVFAQQAPSSKTDVETKKVVLTKKLDVKKALPVDSKSNTDKNTTALPKNEATLQSKKSKKLNVNGSK
jgi:hypothetical protein